MRRIGLLLFWIIFLSCQSNVGKSHNLLSTKEQPKVSANTSTKIINKKIDDFLFISIETGWSKSSRNSNMYVNARLLIKNVSNKEITDIPVLQNQITFNVIENDIIIDEGFATIHSNVLPPWKSDVSKYKTFSSTGFRNMSDKYTNKKLYIEVYYHDKLLWKGKIDNQIIEW